jgi:hypothetical protein
VEGLLCASVQQLGVLRPDVFLRRGRREEQLRALERARLAPEGLCPVQNLERCGPLLLRG